MSADKGTDPEGEHGDSKHEDSKHGDSKHELRALIRGRIRAITPFARRHRARRLAATVLRSPPLAGARVVLAYRAMGDEINIDEVVCALAARGVRVAFPMVRADGSMQLLEIAASDPLAPEHWVRDRFGIAAPNPDAPAARKILPREIDAVIVPGRAFDARGARLGRGKGYYDKLLGRLRPDGRRATIGVCFREQLVESVAEGPLDRRVAFVAAEGRLLRGSRAGRV